MALIFDGSENPQMGNAGDEKSFDDDFTTVKSDEENLTALEKVSNIFLSEWFSLEELYRLAVRFYRGNENKAFHVSYNDRTKIFALTKLVKHGEYKTFHQSTNKNDDVGFFNWVGNDLKDCWEDLGEMSKKEGMAHFVLLLNSLCRQFSAFILAQRQKIEDQKRHEQSEQDFAHKAELQRTQIQDALNTQTLQQFTEYAQKNYPDDPDQQQALIKHLQDQHYVQYMQQLYEQQVNSSQQVPNGITVVRPVDENGHKMPEDSKSDPNLVNSPTAPDAELCVDTTLENSANAAIAPASIWTRKDIIEFKESIKRENSDCVLKISHGAVVQVRVPTHDEGTCLFWEFASDDYDIGFGLYFEWTLSETNTVTVHVVESDDDEEEDIAAATSSHEPLSKTTSDVEEGRVALTTEIQRCGPHQDQVLPVYRRDCHEEVHAGSHAYPGRGVYVLRFDNSYSMWRSKTVYYRVYYSK